MENIRTTVFSGKIPDGCTIKTRIAEDCAKKGRQLLVFDFRRDAVPRRYGACAVRFGDLVPYLSPERCIGILSDFGGRPGDDFRFLSERFIRLFQRYSGETGVNLLDLNAWSMLDLLNDPRGEAAEIKRFLENNFASLPALENYLDHISSRIGTTGADLNLALQACRPLYFHPDRTANETDLQKTVRHLTAAVQDLFPPEETVLLIDGLPLAVAEPFCDMLGSAGYRTNAFFEDLFLYPERVKNTFLNGADKVVFFKHTDPVSVREISSFLGTADAGDVTVTRYPDGNRPFGIPRRSVFGDLTAVTGPSGRNAGYSVARRAKPRLREDEIDALGTDEAIVVDLTDRSYVIMTVD